MIKYTSMLLSLISSSLLSGCITLSDHTNRPQAISGTIESNFEIFSFTTNDKSEESFWINSKSANAENWNLYIETLEDSDIYKNERTAGALVPTIYICVEGSALVQSHKDGVGHLSGWKSDITFTEITSAKTGTCER